MGHDDEHAGHDTTAMDRTDGDATDAPLGDGSDSEEKVAGGGVGALGGAAVGTAVAGPVGTVAGAAIGAVAGAVAGDAAEDAANDDDSTGDRDRRDDDVLI